jgi:hypothetical protein
MTHAPIVIEEDVWIGAAATITPGVIAASALAESLWLASGDRSLPGPPSDVARFP